MSPPPREIRDRYEILEELGEGGMANVMKALQVSLGRVVAIKEIKPAFAAHPELRERFKREARTAAGLVHENIVQVYNFGEPKQGSLFIVMEFVDGQDLKTLLARHGPPPPQTAAFIGRCVARALAYAHARGLIHRDVKPANIMISKRGEVKLMDFGIVREMDSDLTRTGAFLGTPAYMSPEQFLGEHITPAADIFSLGIVLYEMLTGEKPFQADSEASLSRKIRTDREKKVKSLSPAVPRRLQSVVHSCLAKRPDKRHRSAEELALRLSKTIGPRSLETLRLEIVDWQMTPAVGEGTQDIKPTMKKMKAGLPEDDEPAYRAEPRRAQPAGRPAAEAPAKTVPARRPAKSASEAVRPPKERDRPAPSRGKGPAPRVASEARVNSGERLLKWLWWMILLAIATLGAIIMFIIFEPEKGEPASGEKNLLEKAVDRLRPGGEKTPPPDDGQPQ